MHDLGERLIVGEVLEPHGARGGSTFDTPVVSPSRTHGDLFGNRVGAPPPRARAPRLRLARARLTNPASSPTNGSSPSPVTAEMVLDPLDLVGRDVALGSNDDPWTFEQVGLVVAELAQEDLQLFFGRHRRELSERSSKTQSTRARSTWRKKS
jgi:hypothetical protein